MYYAITSQSIIWTITIIMFTNVPTAVSLWDLPCHFYDSTNISSGIRNRNGSISFEGVEYPSYLYGEVNYILKNEDESVPVKKHIRGCLCRIKKCIRLCCPRGQLYDEDFEVCLPNKAAKNLEAEVYADSKSHEKTTIILDDHFGYVHDLACTDEFFSEAKRHKILHTGDIFTKDQIYRHHGYCLLASYDRDKKKPKISAFVCDMQDELRIKLLSYGMLVSVPFLGATIIIYVYTPELRNLQSKCLIGYLTSLVLGYTELALVELNEQVDLDVCKWNGYFIYFAFMSAFLWLNVISFNIARPFRKKNCCQGISDKKLFVLYMIYALGLASLLTLIVYMVEEEDLLPEEWQPGIGGETCFFNRTRELAAFLFFYLPMIVMVMLNMTFFIFTYKKIKQAQREQSISEDSSQPSKKLKRNKQDFLLFLRLFIVMGVTWSCWPLSWAAGSDSWWFILPDIVNVLQGVIIFILFVLRPRVLRLIKKRWYRSTREETASSDSSTQVNQTNIAMDALLRNDKRETQ